MRRVVRAGSSVLLALLACTIAVAQAPGEADLRAALLVEPGQIDRYLQLAQYYERQNRIEDAERLLKEAVSVDPSARRVHEERVRLFAVPFQPRRIGPIAMDWLTVDGTNPVPVLLATGHHLRQASARRGDGTTAALDEIDAALRDVDGAVPANPYHAGLASAKVLLLHARAMLADDAHESQRWLVAARAAQARLDTHSDAESRESDSSRLGETVAAMLRPVPFGPRGAVRAGGRVPAPRLLTDPRLPEAPRPRAARRRLITLELVIDTEGRVVQVFSMDSSEGYDKALGDALGRWRYEPTRLDGEPVPVILTMTVSR